MQSNDAIFPSWDQEIAASFFVLLLQRYTGCCCLSFGSLNKTQFLFGMVCVENSKSSGNLGNSVSLAAWARDKKRIIYDDWNKISRELHSQNRASCRKSVAGLLPCSHQDDIRMRSNPLLRLDDNKSAASCQQAWCKLIVKTFYPQARCKLFQQLIASLQISSCIKSDFHRFDSTWWSKKAWCNIMTQLHEARKVYNLQ